MDEVYTRKSVTTHRSTTRAMLLGALILAAPCPAFLPASLARAQAPAAANRVQGTVKSISGRILTVAAQDGTTSAVTVGDAARVQQSADMKTLSASSFDEIAVGDRVLATGAAGDGAALTATRVILIKSAAIADRNEKTQQDWNTRGAGGIVTSVDPSGTVAISSGTRKIAVDTAPTTIYRRYAPGSVKFEDAKPGTLSEIHAGDQLRVRGDKSSDGLTIKAEEIVSGSFKNLSGTIVSLNADAKSLVIKDLATKKNETVILGEASDLRALPPEMAARFGAARPRSASGGGPAAPGGATAPPAGPPAGGPPPSAGGAPPEAAGGARMGGGYGPGAGRGPGAGGGGRADLAQMIPRLPKAALTDLKPGEALMIVASSSSNTGPYTAITVLSGVEPLLTGPAGSEMTISPWSLGSGGGGEGGGAPE